MGVHTRSTSTLTTQAFLPISAANYIRVPLASAQIAHQFNVRLKDRANERTRLSPELHDTLLQTIQSSKMVADDALDTATDLESMRTAMKRLSNWLGQATEEGRTALNSLGLLMHWRSGFRR